MGTPAQDPAAAPWRHSVPVAPGTGRAPSWSRGGAPVVWPGEGSVAGAAEVVHVAPGEYRAVTAPTLLRTLLGSCVSACLYDPSSGIVGMNHFLLSTRRAERMSPMPLSEAGRYGIHAMELLINEMLRRGARRERLRAKAFGGGAVLGDRTNPGPYPVGEVNGVFLREFLETEGIPLVAADLGGDWGRVIYFSSADFSVHVRRIRGLESLRLGRRDRELWARDVRARVQDNREAELWQGAGPALVSRRPE